MKPSARTSIWPKRGLTILLLWAAAITLIVVQFRAVAAAGADYASFARGHGGIPRVPADWWRACGVLAPLVLIGVALWMQRGWPSPLVRRLGKVGLLLLVPIGLIAVLIAVARGPVALGHVRSPSGAQYILAQEAIPTDAVYTLYQPIGHFGLWWRHIADLDYSEDGRFTGDEKIVLSPDANWLLVTRAGVWTDCFRLVGQKPLQCGTTVYPNWSDASYEADMRARSAEIQRMTGLAPPRLK